jgi:electron transport complex protein RnfG
LRANARAALVSALVLGLFAVLGTGAVTFTYEQTRSRIEANEKAVLLGRLNALVPPSAHDNELLADSIQVSDRELLGTNESVWAYRARKSGAPVAVFLAPVVAPNGYNGAIKLLIAIRHDGVLEGVRVISHRETPGLGDYVEEERSDWIHGFDGRSLGDPPREAWKVRSDGGAFDQITGATVTSRAIVKAVRNALVYFEAHRGELSSQPARISSATGGN